MEFPIRFDFSLDDGLIMWISAPAVRLIVLALLIVAIFSYLLQVRKSDSQSSKYSSLNKRLESDDEIDRLSTIIDPLGNSLNPSNSSRKTRNNGVSANTTFVPFIVLEEPSWRQLSVMLEKYRREAGDLLKGLSQSLELALHSERELGVWIDDTIQPGCLFSERLRRRIQRVSDCLDHNEEQLSRMMQLFEVQFVLPSTESDEDEDLSANNNPPVRNDDWSITKTSRLFIMKKSFPGSPSGNEKKTAYDCGAQVVAHVVRDWTVLGEPVRASIYDWCRSQVEEHVPQSTYFSILVPGAGLGRLAYDISFVSGYSVEANEISVSMAAAAHSILQKRMSGAFYPFALDYFANEVEAERRYDIVRYPDVDIETHRIPNFSYTLGDFVDIYRRQRPRGSFSAVVTCFFIDTSTNIYEYLATIRHSLCPGGVWINVGPLRWHANSLLHPSVDELRTLVESSLFGFEVLHWSVDETASEYRHVDHETRADGSQFVRSTAYDGYRPLRFVARKRKQ